jgi:integrase
MNQKELNTLLDFIQKQNSPEPDELISIVLKMASDSAALKAVKNKPAENGTGEKKYLKFTKQELEIMPAYLKQILLMYNGNAVTYRYHNGTYETRYRRDGYKVAVYAPDLKTLRMKFLDKIANSKPATKEDTSVPLMKEFTAEWMKIKTVSVKDSTIKSYTALIDSHINPNFGDKRISTITRSDVQTYLTNLVNQDKNRTAQKLKQLLSAIFDVACEDYGIKSPMAKIELPHYEVQKGTSLTKAEERILVDYCLKRKNTTAASAVLTLLYTGMRVGELKTAVLHDNYIECETEKIRKGYAVERRKIPISPMLRKVMPFIDFDKAFSASRDWIKTFLKDILPSHHTHELRYTFITRAKEAGCNLELVMLWDGHKFDAHVKSSAVDRGYTTYSDEYYFKEIEKIDYDF